MAQDIYPAVSGQAIKHGTIIVCSTGKGDGILDYIDRDDSRVINTPELASITGKYDARWDDPRFYSGDTAN